MIVIIIQMLSLDRSVIIVAMGLSCIMVLYLFPLSLGVGQIQLLLIYLDRLLISCLLDFITTLENSSVLAIIAHLQVDYVAFFMVLD